MLILLQSKPNDILEACFTASEKALDIPRMLEVGDLIDIEKPDEHSVMAYISAHYHVFSTPMPRLSLIH